jgi:cell division protein ZapA (FtsZ GTPase activity inhibitor)
MSEKRNISVLIAGKTYSVLTDESETTLTEAAQQLDLLMKDIVGASSLSAAEINKKLTFIALKFSLESIKNAKKVVLIAEKSSFLCKLIDDNLSP